MTAVKTTFPFLNTRIRVRKSNSESCRSFSFSESDLFVFFKRVLPNASASGCQRSPTPVSAAILLGKVRSARVCVSELLLSASTHTRLFYAGLCHFVLGPFWFAQKVWNVKRNAFDFLKREFFCFLLVGVSVVKFFVLLERSCQSNRFPY